MPIHEPDPGTPSHPEPAARRDDSARTTPAADLQADDASSDNTPSADLGDAGDRGHTGEHPRAERAMKQQDKTERGR